MFSIFHKRVQAVIACSIIWLLHFFVPLCGSAQNFSSAYTDSVLRSASYNNACGIDNLFKQLRSNPAYADAEKKMNDAIYKRITGNRIKMNGSLPATPVTLPVVVHIISDNPDATTDATVIAAIQNLNEAFSKTGAYAASKGADTKLRFVLAKKDPNGGVSTGITRTKSHYGTNMTYDTEDFRMKNLINWDPIKYINVWLVDNIVYEIGAGFGCGVWNRKNAAGYAFFPVNPTFSSAYDGIVVSGFGALLAHEMGHYLGLYHTFDGGCNNNNCLTDGDRVCDTPPDTNDDPIADCTQPNNSCGTDTLSAYSNGFFPRDTTDQITNFMDYSGTCRNQFTEGQAERMHAAIATQRPGLVNDAITAPCGGAYLAGFTRNNPDPKPTETITFTASTAGGVLYEWFVNGAKVQTGTTMSRSFPDRTTLPFPFNKHEVTLKVTDGSGCVSSYTDYVITNCGLTPRFSYNKRYIASLNTVLVDTILFTNNSMSTISPGTPTYEWILADNITNQQQTITTNAAGGGPNDLNYAFPNYGNYSLRLKATLGSCTVESDRLYLFIADPRRDAYMAIINANCFQDTKVRVQFYVCNFGFDTIMPNLPVVFYDKDPALPGANKIDDTFIIPDTIKGNCCGRVYIDTLNVGYRKLNKIYAVANNVTTAIPLVFPDPALVSGEKDYANNTANVQGFAYKGIITSNPAASNAAPGDTLRLNVQGNDGTNSILWFPPDSLSCTSCSSPFYYADTNATKTKYVVVKSFYQCTDTASIEIKVPTYNDYTVTIGGVSCSPNEDSLFVDFTIRSLFKRGIIPKGLQVSLYRDDPMTAAATLLAPAFTVPDSVKAKQQTYRVKVKKVLGRSIFAAVNNAGTAIPITGWNPSLPETDYTNNLSSFLYHPISGGLIDTAICSGLSYKGHTVSGVYSDTILSKGGCDSVVTLNLTVKAAAATLTTVNITICEGGNYAGYTATGTYVDVFPGSNTCDSVRTLHLTVNPVKRTSLNVKICKGQSFFVAGKLQTVSGAYLDTLKAVSGCDSIITTQLTVDPLLPIQYTVSICRGNRHFAAGKWQTESGVYRDTTVSSAGCDSVTITTLTVQPIIQASYNISICKGKTYFAGGKAQAQSGVYADTTKNANGCDSITITNLTVQPIIQASYNVGICRGQSYFAGGKAQTQSGAYADTTKTAGGCDSVTITNLTVHQLPAGFLPEDTTICATRTLEIFLNGYQSVNWSTGSSASTITISEPGVYTAQVVDRNGCAGSDAITVKYEKCIALQVPGAFTPNNDGKNDTFKPLVGVPPKNYIMRIYNRWGLLLFSTYDHTKGWDGRFNAYLQPAGAYVYNISLVDPDGTVVTKTGTLVLIR